MSEGETVNVGNLEGFETAYERMAAAKFEEDFNEAVFYEDIFYKSNISRSKFAFFFVSEISESLNVLFERLKRENVAVVCYVVGGSVPEDGDRTGIKIIELPTEDKLSEVM